MHRRSRFAISTVALLITFGLMPSTASAVPFTVLVPGNDCPTQPACIADETGTYADGRDGSPWIIKFSADLSSFAINALFPSIDGSEFDIDLAAGTWTYTPGIDDPVVKFWVAKGGPNYNLFYDDAGGVGGLGTADPVTSGDFFTPTNPNNNKPYGLSHLSFFDTGDAPDPLPEPALILLFGLAAAGAGYRLRRQR